MSRPIISVEGLGKCYRVGHQSAKREHYTALRDILARNTKELFRKTRDLVSGRQIIQGDVVEDFWALKDVSFDVEPGEVVGIIGRNGAGKSTLLKILSRITEPTEGRVTLRGRVASLLEVGTGFHPELSGRENIFLNGAILGMTRNEIKRKFDEIVDFAEVEKFLDTPVKRYSSGMYVRLAFAVAAHLEPEILIVDEVLAVGDAEFQKKCLGKMGEVAKGGRTVLFVSHNLGAISGLCSSAILLQNGSVTFRGGVGDAIRNYSDRNKPEPVNLTSIVLTEELTLSYLRITPQKMKGAGKLNFKLTVEGSAAVEITGFSMLFLNEEGIRLGIIDFRCFSTRFKVRPKSPLTLSGSVDLPELVEGNISIGLYVETTDFGKNFFDLAYLTVEPSDASKITPYPSSARGIISLTAQNLEVSG
jgi:lipopolysaccharide transport system ATP-binding protein